MINIEEIEAEAHRLGKAGNRLEAIKTIRQALGSLTLALKWANTHYPAPSPINESIRLSGVRHLRQAAESLRQAGFSTFGNAQPGRTTLQGSRLSSRAKRRNLLRFLYPSQLDNQSRADRIGAL